MLRRHILRIANRQLRVTCRVYGSKMFRAIRKVPSRAAGAGQPARRRSVRTSSMYHLLWNVIHQAAWLYPTAPTELQKMDVRHFYINFGGIIRCGRCRRHYMSYIAQHPPNTSSRDALFQWTVRLHNNVNRRTGKPEWAVQRAQALYQPGHVLYMLRTTYRITLGLWIQQGTLRSRVPVIRNRLRI